MGEYTAAFTLTSFALALLMVRCHTRKGSANTGTIKATKHSGTIERWALNVEVLVLFQECTHAFAFYRTRAIYAEYGLP